MTVLVQARFLSPRSQRRAEPPPTDSVGEPDLHAVGGSVVARLGLDHLAAAGVLERSGGGLIEVPTDERRVVVG